MEREHELQSIITSPPHYVDGRSIEPITVIETFGLCHHLACVVKYIARAGRKNPILEDLRKAEWYLDRAVSNNSACCQSDELIPQDIATGATLVTFSQKICDDWQLSDSLCSAILNIFFSKSLHSHLSKVKVLNSALDCLKEEISIQEMLHDSKLSVKRETEFKEKIDNRVSHIIKKIRKEHPIQFSIKKSRVA